MSDVSVEHKQSLSREQTAVWLHVLSRALSKGGDVALPVGSDDRLGTIISLQVPDELTAEFEVEVNGDQVQVELELTWSVEARSEDAEVGAVDGVSEQPASG